MSGFFVGKRPFTTIKCYGGKFGKRGLREGCRLALFEQSCKNGENVEELLVTNEGRPGV